MTQELLNEAFSAKVTQQKPSKHHKESYGTPFQCKNEVGSRFVITDTQTDGQNEYRNPTAHAPRVKYWLP